MISIAVDEIYFFLRKNTKSKKKYSIKNFNIPSREFKTDDDDDIEGGRRRGSLIMVINANDRDDTKIEI